jgi:hypothetical protein
MSSDVSNKLECEYDYCLSSWKLDYLMSYETFYSGTRSDVGESGRLAPCKPILPRNASTNQSSHC